MPRLDASTTLPDGRRLRLRLPHASDAAGVRGLFEQAGLECDDLLLGRLRRFDPLGRVSLVAVVLVGRAEQVAGLALADRLAEHVELLVSDEALAPGAAAALEMALDAHARRSRRAA
jgi:hypothetical protein